MMDFGGGYGGGSFGPSQDVMNRFMGPKPANPATQNNTMMPPAIRMTPMGPSTDMNDWNLGGFQKGPQPPGDAMKRNTTQNPTASIMPMPSQRFNQSPISPSSGFFGRLRGIAQNPQAMQSAQNMQQLRGGNIFNRSQQLTQSGSPFMQAYMQLLARMQNRGPINRPTNPGNSNGGIMGGMPNRGYMPTMSSFPG